MKEAAGRRIGTHLSGWKGMEGVHTEEVRAKLGACPSDHVCEITKIPNPPVPPASEPIELNRDPPCPTRAGHRGMKITAIWDYDDGHCRALGTSWSGCLQGERMVPKREILGKGHRDFVMTDAVHDRPAHNVHGAAGSSPSCCPALFLFQSPKEANSAEFIRFYRKANSERSRQAIAVHDHHRFQHLSPPFSTKFTQAQAHLIGCLNPHTHDGEHSAEAVIGHYAAATAFIDVGDGHAA